MGRCRKIPDQIYDFVAYNDVVDKGDGRLMYRTYCKRCGSDRGYKRPNKFDAVCVACQKAHMRSCMTSKSWKAIADKNRARLQGKVAWNKGKTDFLSDEARKTMSDRHIKYNSEDHRRLRKNLSSLINQKLKRRAKGIKDASTFDVLPYTIDDLIIHLLSKAYPHPITGEKMTLENHGKYGWHIDHVIPDSWFTYNSMLDQGFKDSWDLSNLQPLWAIDNLRKHNRYIGK